MLARIPVEGQKTRDITGGLPRVAELFEARSPKDKGTLAERPARCRSARRPRAGAPADHRPGRQGHEDWCPKEKNILVHEGQVVNKGESIVDGPADPQDILRLLGIEELARYIVDEVQDVYRLQGVKINDKHIEVIVRQMLRRVQIVNRATRPTSLASRSSVPSCWTPTTACWPRARSRPRTPTCCWASPRPRCPPTLFISAASFQETTRVLTEAAIMGQARRLRGLEGERHRRPPDPRRHRHGLPRGARKVKEAMDDAERRAIAIAGGRGTGRRADGVGRRGGCGFCRRRDRVICRRRRGGASRPFSLNPPVPAG